MKITRSKMTSITMKDSEVIQAMLTAADVKLPDDTRLNTLKLVVTNSPFTHYRLSWMIDDKTEDPSVGETLGPSTKGE